MTSPVVDPLAAASDRSSLTTWASDDEHVGALNVIWRMAKDRDDFRELALMLGYGEKKMRERYQRGLEARRNT